jgi:DNA-directed RNA polymerase specialized sigma24 family protein
VLRDHQLAEDAVQEVFARGLVHLRRLKETGKFGPWLGRICRNVAVNSEEPNWEGEEALSVARRWFREQFGVTFMEETRTMKTCVVQQR